MYMNSLITNQDEYLHRIQRDNWDWIETTWFGNTYLHPTPDRHIIICPYTYIRRTAGIVYTVFYISEGILDHHLQATYWNSRMWSRMPEGDFDQKGIKFQTGLSIKMLEPGKVFQIDYEDEEANTECHFIWTGVSPRMPWVTDNHFDQVGHVKGYIILRGERLEIDTYNVRDRGWAPRNDAPVINGPSFDYIACIMDEKNAFGVFGFDKETLQLGSDAKPTWTAQVKDAEFLPTSWRLKDGVPRRIRSYDCTVKRAPNGWRQDEMEGLIVDEDYEEIHVKAKITAHCPYIFPHNNITTNGMYVGEVNGKKVYGKWDETLDNDAMLYLMQKKREREQGK